jgi:hypothetical protein
MKKLKKLNAACAVLALHYVSGRDEDAVLRICKLHGFEVGYGMEDEEWRNAADELGIKVRSIATLPLKVHQFIKNNSTGLFIVGTFNHLFVVDNGIVIDPRFTPPGMHRVIKQVWRVTRG